MHRNVEIKAKITNRPHIEAIVRRSATGNSQPEDLQQEDTFFRTTNGRLKLRVIDGARAELIHYFRDDERGPKPSRYSIVPVPDPNLLRRVLDDLYGVRATVRKERRVYLIGNTRVHLDTVDGLGEFLELEVVLAQGESEAEGTAEARRLMAEFGIGEEDLAEGAYVDLLENAEVGVATEFRDAFLSEEDLDLRNLSEEELIAYWNLWLRQAQVTNDLDAAYYSHGVFERDPAVDLPENEKDRD